MHVSILTMSISLAHIHVFSSELKTVPISTLPYLKYTPTSHPFAKWDKVEANILIS